MADQEIKEAVNTTQVVTYSAQCPECEHWHDDLEEDSGQIECGHCGCTFNYNAG